MTFRSLVHIKQAHRFSVSCVSWYPTDTGMFASSSMDSTVKVWDTNAVDTACTFHIGERVYCIAMSPVARAHALIAGVCLNQW